MTRPVEPLVQIREALQERKLVEGFLARLAFRRGNETGKVSQLWQYEWRKEKGHSGCNPGSTGEDDDRAKEVKYFKP